LPVSFPVQIIYRIVSYRRIFNGVGELLRRPQDTFYREIIADKRLFPAENSPPGRFLTGKWACNGTPCARLS